MFSITERNASSPTVCLSNPESIVYHWYTLTRLLTFELIAGGVPPVLSRERRHAGSAVDLSRQCLSAEATECRWTPKVAAALRERHLGVGLLAD